MLLTTRELNKMKRIDRSDPNYWQVGREIKFKEVPVMDYICYSIAGIVMLLSLFILIKVAL